MKKITALLLSVIMLLSLAACGGEKTNEAAKETETKAEALAAKKIEKKEEKEEKKKSDTEKNSGEEEKKDDTKEKKADAEKASEAAQAEQPKTEEKKQAGFSLGVSEGDTYTNEYVGLMFRLPDSSWKFYTDEQIAEANGLAGKTPEEVRAAAESKRQVYAMAAESSVGAAASVIYENLGEDAKSVDASQYLAVSTAKTKEGYEKAGVTDLNIENGVVKVGETELPAVQLSYTANGIERHQASFCIKRDERMALVVITAADAEKLAAALSAFHTME